MKKSKIIIIVFAIVCCVFHINIIAAEPRDPNHKVIKSSLAKLICSALGEPNLPNYAKVIPPEKLKEDLDFLFKTIKEVHPNMYAYTSKEEFAPLRDNLYKQIERPMTGLDFYKITAPVIAALKNTHTYMVPFIQEYKQYFESGGRVFPLELRLSDLKIIISKNFSSVSLPVGGEILTINSRQASNIWAEFSCWFASEGRNTNPHLIENTVLLRDLLWLEFGPTESWQLKIKDGDTKISDFTVKSATATELKGQESANDFDPKNSYRYLPDYNAALLDIPSFGGDSEKFKNSLKETFQKICSQNVLNLIIDIRKNDGGGDLCISRLMEFLTSKPFRLYEKTGIKICPQTSERIQHIRNQLPDKFADKKDGSIVTLELPLQNPGDNPFRFTGRTFILVGQRSFSASTVFASAVKCFHIGTLVGEETPDPTIFYADSVKFTMPNSGLEVAVASKSLYLAGGTNNGRGVIPDYEVKQTQEDTAKDIDTVLQFTLDLIKKSGSETSSEQKADNPVQTERKEK